MSIVKLLSTLPFIAACVGCGLEAGDAAGETVEGLDGSEALFESTSYASSNGAAEVERFAECGENEILTGLGARAVSGNVTDLTIYCREILDDGQLSEDESRYVEGGSSEEQRLEVDDGQVAVGVGSIVSHDNVARLVLKQCPWLAESRTVDVAQCSETSTASGTFSAEAFIDAHGSASSEQKPRVVLAGAGLTSTHDNVYAVRAKIGYLK